MQMPVPLHRLEEDRQQRPQPFAADPVGRLPDHEQRLAYSLVVNPAAGPRAMTPVYQPCPHTAPRRLAVITGYRRNLVQYPTALAPIPPRIAVRYRCHQLVTRRHADPPHY